MLLEHRQFRRFQPVLTDEHELVGIAARDIGDQLIVVVGNPAGPATRGDVHIARHRVIGQ